MPGGVCQVLDYEVELMAEYVSEMATRIIMPRSGVSAPFRKFVSQILTSTRLPSTTILLGLNYLAKRINMMAAAGHTNHTEGQTWRMLTISLLLGSKFLDDNTFQNKSWSEVSGIPVKELNTLEYEWLGAISWGLYVNMDESKDYNAWLKNWTDWLETKKRALAQSRERFAPLATPIEPELARPRNPHLYSTWHQQQVAEYERLSSVKHGQAPQPAYRHEQPSWAYQSWHAAPLTPPDSGYGTPEYANSAASVNSQYNEWFDRAVTTNTASDARHFQQPPSYTAFHHPVSQSSRGHASHTGYYNYGQSIWEAPHVGECNCMSCGSHVGHKQHPYFMAHGYGQPVVG
jgi:hypothetical protein